MKKSFLRLISLLVIVCTICFQLIGCVNITGPQGPKGDMGEQGPKGDMGEQGPMGVMGMAGLDGADGKDGLSAYEIAVLNGFNGTEQEWLDSLSCGDCESNGCNHNYGRWVNLYPYASSCEEKVYIRGCLDCMRTQMKYGSEDDHQYNKERFYNTLYHYNICDLCSVIFNMEEHTFDSKGMCSYCGYVDRNDSSNREIVRIWVSEFNGVAKLTEAQIEEFLAANPDVAAKYRFEVSGVNEADAATQVLVDITQAPDIYCFAQDSLARLVQADALAVPGQQAAANVKAANDAISVSAASVAGTLYAYPLTSDNGCYMYYDKSVITNPDDLAQIVKDCEDADKNICFELENAWYTASFFMATGCVNNWTMNENGKFTSVKDTYNSEAGIVAMKGMQIVTKSENYVNTSNEFANAGIIITGIWNANTAEETFGANLGVTDLPSFTVDGESYHLSSFSGNKLMGVKPQADAQKLAMLHELAQYLSGYECQIDRYERLQWGPSNLEAQASDAVKSNPHLAALALQNEYAIPQGNIHGSWWDIARLLGAESKNAVTDEDLQLALDTYTASIEDLFINDNNN